MKDKDLDRYIRISNTEEIGSPEYSMASKIVGHEAVLRRQRHILDKNEKWHDSPPSIKENPKGETGKFTINPKLLLRELMP